MQEEKGVTAGHAVPSEEVGRHELETRPLPFARCAELRLVNASTAVKRSMLLPPRELGAA
jgi:hypothetical protein